ncbi:MAG: hypothetical protein WD825_00795 [Gemmatimonadaceae bacterium]
MFARLRNLALILVALASPSLGSAQQTNGDTARVAGPTLEATTTAFRRLDHQPVDSAAIMQRSARSGTNRSVALMIVGGAAIVLGSVIDEPVGSLFIIGGAVAVLYGLYLYLQ